MAADTHYSTLDLRQMDEQEARNTLTVAEYERWEKLHENIEAAEETRERFAAEDELVEDITVRADMDALGTDVDLYDNDVVVYIDSENDRFREAADALDGELGDTDPEDVADLDRETIDTVAEHLKTMLDCALVEWNGHEWDALGADTRRDVLATCREKWGVDGLLLAWFDIAKAVSEDRQEKVEAVDSFRNEERRGRRGDSR